MAQERCIQFRSRRKHKRRLSPLTEAQRRAIDMLAEYSRTRNNHEVIAKRLGISRMTLWRWRQRVDFNRALTAITNRKAAVAIDRLYRMMEYRTSNVDYIERLFARHGLV